MDIRQQFAANVKRLRKAKDLSQEQLAFETGIHRTYISGVERSIRNPTLVIVGRISKALGVEPIELFRPGELRMVIAPSSRRYSVFPSI